MASPLPGHARKLFAGRIVRKRPGARPRPFSALFNVARKPAGSNHHGSHALSGVERREQILPYRCRCARAEQSPPEVILIGLVVRHTDGLTKRL